VISRSALEHPDPGAENLDTPAGRALVASLGNNYEQGAPRTGWRLVLDRPGFEIFAAQTGDGTWDTIEVQEKDGQWSWAGNTGGQSPIQTPVQRGAGLELTWPGAVELPSNQYPVAHVELVNDRSTPWVDDRGEYWAVAHVFDRRTGRSLLPTRVAIAGVGRSYDLAPGESAELPVAISPDAKDLQPGTYDIVACVSELNLASPVGTLHVSG
jgi:hypothetical protein